MVAERGLATATERSSDPEKAELQERIEQARDSITDTVGEIKDSVEHKVESMKETLDWHEQVKKRPISWSVGAMGAGLVVGWGVGALIKGQPSVNQTPTPAQRDDEPAEPGEDLMPMPSKPSPVRR